MDLYKRLSIKLLRRFLILKLGLWKDDNDEDSFLDLHYHKLLTDCSLQKIKAEHSVTALNEGIFTKYTAFFHFES